MLRKILLSLSVVSATACVSSPAPHQMEEYKFLVHSQVQTLAPKIQQCYIKAREKSPKLVGDIAPEFFVTREGTVTGLSFNPKRTTIHEPLLKTCIKTELEATTFPAPIDGERVFIIEVYSFKESNTNIAPAKSK